jgi:hypothetical protein
MRYFLRVDNFILATLFISSAIAASVNLPDYHEALLETPVTENKEKGEIFLEELDTSRRIHQRPVDLSGDDKEVPLFVSLITHCFVFR